MNFVVSSFVKHSPGIWCENLGGSAILKLYIQCYCIFALSWLYNRHQPLNIFCQN